MPPDSDNVLKSDERAMAKLVTDVKHCARCDQDHDRFVFTTFRLNPVLDTDGTVWNYWGLCPVTGEPILMKVEDDHG